jgi:hypothetical protein
MKKTDDHLSISISMIIMTVCCWWCLEGESMLCHVQPTGRLAVKPQQKGSTPSPFLRHWPKRSCRLSTPRLSSFFFFTSAAMIYLHDTIRFTTIVPLHHTLRFSFTMLTLLLLPKARRALACVWSAKKKVHSQHARHHEPPFIHHCLFRPRFVCFLH